MEVELLSPSEQDDEKAQDEFERRLHSANQRSAQRHPPGCTRAYCLRDPEGRGRPHRVVRLIARALDHAAAGQLDQRIECSVPFACSFLLRNHWRLLQHLDRRSQAEQSKIAGIGELLVRLVWKEMPVVEDLL